MFAAAGDKIEFHRSDDKTHSSLVQNSYLLQNFSQ